MRFPDIVEQLAHEIPRARRLVSGVNFGEPELMARRDAIRSALLSLLCHLSMVGVEHFSGTGMFLRRLKTRPLPRTEAERVLQLVADINALLPAVSKGSPWQPEARETLRKAAEVLRMIEQIEREWGHFRGTARLYVPYYIVKSAGDLELFVATGELTWPGGGGGTLTAWAGRNDDPNTPEVAAGIFREFLARDVAKLGAPPLEALPFPPPGLSAVVRVKVP